ncbi:MAG: hypothetical protein P8L18_05045 [Verrucomicrobiota bacterium]|nr:hypothetical protein [Verrucomicrobiota bacterium]
MKTSNHFHGSLFLLALCMLTTEGLGQVQIEHFNDGNDAGWERFSPLDAVGTSSIFTLPALGEGNHAYRLQSPAPAIDAAGPARSFSNLPQVYSNFYAAMDIVDWNNDVNQAFGFLLRGDNIGLGQTTGYVMNYDPQQASGARGQIQFNIVTGEADAGTIGAADLSLEPGHAYRFVTEVMGDTFRGWVYDHLDMTAPIVTYSGEDNLYDSGQVGLFNFYRGGDATDPDLGIADTTFDNIHTAEEAPASLGSFAEYGFAGQPYVVHVEPANRAAYQSASAGLRYTVALPEGMLAAPTVRLSINGRDVSGQVNTTLDGSTLHGTLEALEANRVYDATIELPDNTVLGRTEWTFDTFEQGFLTSEAVVVIEAEDYNFDGGKYLNTPDPSGFTAAGQGVNTATGYLDREGIPELDFFDYSEAPGPEEEAAFRAFDPVRTQAGSSETGSAAQFSGADPAVNDSHRKAMSDLKIPEYQVTGTRGTEWMNYTRDLPEGIYNVYLRAAGRATQDIHLDEVTSDPKAYDQTTHRLGSFNLPNMGMKFNYRFVALKDADGAMTRLNLGGVTTLRITMGDEDLNRVNNTSALNYLLLTPAIEETPEEPAISVLGSATVDGIYLPVPGVVIENMRLTVPAGENMQFFKILGSPGILKSVTIEDNTFSVQFAVD